MPLNVTPPTIFKRGKRMLNKVRPVIRNGVPNIGKAQAGNSRFVLINLGPNDHRSFLEQFRAADSSTAQVLFAKYMANIPGSSRRDLAKHIIKEQLIHDDELVRSNAFYAIEQMSRSMTSYQMALLFRSIHEQIPEELQELALNSNEIPFEVSWKIKNIIAFAQLIFNKISHDLRQNIIDRFDTNAQRNSSVSIIPEDKRILPTKSRMSETLRKQIPWAIMTREINYYKENPDAWPRPEPFYEWHATRSYALARICKNLAQFNITDQIETEEMIVRLLYKHDIDPDNLAFNIAPSSGLSGRHRFPYLLPYLLPDQL